jgi:hypothetical protein
MDGDNAVTNEQITGGSNTKRTRNRKGKNNDSDNPSTAATDTETGTTTDVGQTNNEREQIEEDHGLPVLSLDTAPIKRTRSTSKVTSKVKDEKTLEANINVMLTTIFGLLSLRLGQHWEMSQEECNGISEPLSRILNRMIPAETSGKYTDYILLTAGLTLTITPRIMLSKELSNVKTSETKPIHTLTNEGNSTTTRTEVGFDDNSIKSQLPGY